jgi:hypothetical protein
MRGKGKLHRPKAKGRPGGTHLMVRKSVIRVCVAACLLAAVPSIARPGEARAATAPVAGVPHCALPDSTALQKKRWSRDRIHVVGNREVNGFGQTWIPYGISVYGGLQDGDHNYSWQPTIAASMAQIEASPFWHANAVRIQWAEGNIFHDVTSGYTVNVAFLQALCDQVREVRSLGGVAILNDNTEFPDWGEVEPTTRTELSWKIVIQEFGNQPGWIADLYNEPRLSLADQPRPYTQPRSNWLWQIWQHGGTVQGKEYVGLQQLVNYTRQLGFKGVEWLEPPFLQGLNQAHQFPIRDPRHDIVWAFHHAPMPSAAAHGATSQWYNDFGYLTRSYPVVDAEWNQAAAPLPECNPTAYYTVPPFLRYLRSVHVGMLAWSLQPGSMVAELRGQHLVETNITKSTAITNPKLLERPSHMYPNYACTSSRVGEGAGNLVLNYFRQYSIG